MAYSENCVLSFIICAMNFAKAVFRVVKRHTFDHLLDASINTMKYLNGPHGGWIGPHISPCILSKNIGDSLPTFAGDGRVISFP
ncbi:hypothetical protein N665_0057s0020 [Sinapis alba]|nr:hypothetical protein N665_0057s0020 [Sinapis alba]